MNTRRIARLAAVACLLAGAVVGLVPAPSSAEAPQATGWWSRRLPLQGEVEGRSARAAVRFTPAPRQELPDPPVTVPDPSGGPPTTLPLPVPPPTLPESPVTLPEDPGPGTQNPTVPEGGLWVANDPSGAVAMSALRYRGDIGTGELTLRFAPGSTTVGPIVACPALSEFTPGPGGAWGDRPAHDCDRMSLTGRRSSDGTGMQFTIPQGFLPFGGRVLDIVVLPDPARGDPFSVYFEAPGAGSLEVIQGQELPPPVAELPDPDPLTLPTTPPVSDSGFDSGAAVGGSLGGTGEVAGPASPADSGGDSPSAPSPIAEFLEPFTESRVGRIISVAVLLAMGAGLWLFGGQPVRRPRLLGALAGDAPVLVDRVGAETGRGLGQFRRERSDLPPRL